MYIYIYKYNKIELCYTRYLFFLINFNEVYGSITYTWATA